MDGLNKLGDDDVIVVMLQVMALDESCLACGPGEQEQGPVMSREARDEAFTRNYKRYVFPADSLKSVIKPD